MKSGKVVATFILGSVLLVAVFAFASMSLLGKQIVFATPTDDAVSVYELQTTDLEGELVDLAEFRGRVTLAVNVASRCGMTPQYAGLQQLHEELAEKGFSVLGFPSNDFMGQEPGSPEEIRAFCEENYGVTFPMFSKRSVKGEQKDEVYVALTQRLEEPSWNFTKYLIDRDGTVLARFGPRVKPESEELRAAILAALDESS